MNLSNLLVALQYMLDAGLPVLIWGKAGIGKSAAVKSIATGRGIGFIDFRGSQVDAVDLRGLPVPDLATASTSWLVPDFFPRDGEGILFLDEITSAPPSVQAALYQLVLDRRLGDYVLPDGWQIVAAANPASERGVYHAMPKPLLNRFVHLTLEADAQEWSSWAVSAGIEIEIIAWMRFAPQHLLTENVGANETSWSTPRTLEYASRILKAYRAKHNDLGPLLRQMLIGAIGEAAAIELLEFMRLMSSLPSTDEILLNPHLAPLPDDPSHRIVVATALGRVVTDASFDKAVSYLERFKDGEFVALMMRDATARDRAITSTRAFVETASKYLKLVA